MNRNFGTAWVLIPLSIAAAAGTTQAATLSLRWEGSTGDTVQRLVCENAVIEIVLELNENESLGFGILFPGSAVVDGSGGVIEVLDAFAEAGPLADATYDRSAFPDPGPPYDPGQGIVLGLGGYSLNLGNANLTGPVTVVLDNIEVHATSLGTVEITFGEGLFVPQLFNGSLLQFAVLPAGTANLEGAIVLGLGDSRSGGAGPLVFEVVEDVPPPPIENENSNTAGNTNANSNVNGNTNTGGGGGGGGGGSLCGLGMLAPTALLALLLSTLRFVRRPPTNR